MKTPYHESYLNGATVRRSVARCAAMGLAVSLLGGCAGGGSASGPPMMPVPPGPGPNPLSYVSWGPWAAGGNVGAPPTGTLTPPAAMPQTGTAEYSGAAYATNGKSGTVGIAVDFGTLTIRMGVHFPDNNPNSSGVTAHAAGPLTGNSYWVVGHQELDLFTNDASYDLSASGAFYGPSASETAGTFSLRYTGVISTRYFDGSFGAKICSGGC